METRSIETTPGVRGPEDVHLRRRIVGLLLAGALLAIVSNAVVPGRLAWSPDSCDQARARLLEDGIEMLSLSELADRSRPGGSTIFDARGLESYAEGHVPGALPAPAGVADHVAAFEATRRDLSAPLVIYCSGAFCDAAMVTAAAFRERGFASVAVCVEGFEGWRGRGLPVEEGMPAL